MTLKSTVKRVGALSACLLLLAVAKVALAAGGNEISGTYTVQQSSDQGPDIRVTLHVTLTSSADSNLQSAGVSLRSLFSGNSQEISAIFSLPANGNADFTAAVTVSRAEYKQWQGGAKPILVLKLQTQDGSTITRTVALSAGVRGEAK